MSGLDLFTVGAEQFRLGSWRGHDTIGYLVPLCPPERLSGRGLERSLQRLADRGYTQVFTAALTDDEQRVFLRHGFVAHERLHLLQHDLHPLPDRPPPPVGVKIRAGRRWQRSRVLEIDSRAFDSFWRLDLHALDEAIAATPARHFRIAWVGAQPVGYAVSGAAGRAGYLQRLAVEPEHAGRGVGQSLVFDSLEWMHRNGVTCASVNTQEHNERALALYQRMGFARVDPGLAVFRRALAP